MPRKVLQDSAYAMSLQSLDHFVGKCCRHSSVCSEGTPGHNGILRIGQHICYRGKIHIKAQISQISSDFISNFICLLRFTRGSDLTPIRK